MSRTQPRGDGTDADDESLNVEPPPASSRQSSRGPYQRSDSFVAKQDLIDQLAAKDDRLRSLELVARKNEDETAKALEEVKKLRERNAALERAFASAADTVVERTTPPPSEPSSETHVSNRMREAFNLTPDTPAGGHLKSGEARTADATKSHLQVPRLWGLSPARMTKFKNLARMHRSLRLHPKLCLELHLPSFLTE